MDEIIFNSIETLPSAAGRVAFHSDSSEVFKEDVDVVPIVIDDTLSYIPWGDDNNMPYDVLRLIENDETVSTCQQFNAEICYGGGLLFNTASATPPIQEEVEDFLMENNLASLYLGACQDFKHFGWCVTALILNPEGTKIVRMLRKEVCYCRFSPADKNGHSKYVLYANWRKAISSRKDIEAIELLDIHSPFSDLAVRMGQAPGPDGKRRMLTLERKFAVVTRIPTPDHTYYPIPPYAALFKGKWYNIKQLIGMAKEAKLKNSAPIKYQIEISRKYWDNIFQAEGITDRVQRQERVKKEKQQILDFLTGAENAGKVWFSQFYINPNGDEVHDVVINKIDQGTEGGDWESDIQEAVNMICFTMRVHSNLVGSVPGKAQMNNSGSDKRELYTIAQALQKPYHDLLFIPFRLLIKFNAWARTRVECPFIQLTTLDEHQDAKTVTLDNNS